MSALHGAARDGHLDLLHRASRREADLRDEDGRTPVLWAAHHGHLDALRLLIGRGGNPDKADCLGSSALHLAAAGGRHNCAAFLVALGANIWALDNDFHTPLDVAVLNGHLDIAKQLDTAITLHSARNVKVVNKMKEKAVMDAQRRVKRYKQLQDKAQRRAEREDKRLAKDVQKLTVVCDNDTASNNHIPQSSSGTLARSSPSLCPRPYSEHCKTTERQKSFLTGVAKRIRKRSRLSENDFKVGERGLDGTQTLRSLSGLKRDHQVLYVSRLADTASSGSDESRQQSRSVPDLLCTDSGVESAESTSMEQAGIFERPGFGSVSFLRNEALLSLPQTDCIDDADSVSVDETSENSTRELDPSFTDSIGTVGSLNRRMRELELPWDDLDSLDEGEESSPLETFLASYNIAEYFTVFSREKIDMAALMLLSDEDMKEIGLPMGPRRKVLGAVEQRRNTLATPDPVMTTFL